MEDFTRENWYSKTKNYVYYIIIAVVSFVSVVFLPMIGSDVEVGWNLPETSAAWTVWVLGRLMIAAVNCTIFYAFNEQGRANVRNDEKYKEAIEILGKSKKTKLINPRSPVKWKAETYGRKGAFIFIVSGASLAAFSQAVLAYDWTTLLAFTFTIIGGLVFGVLQMKKSEEYWTTEFWQYAKRIESEENSEVPVKEESECLSLETKSSET